MSDGTDVGVPHELRMLVGHWHEAWMEEKESIVNTDTNAWSCSASLLENSVVRRTERKLTHCMSLLYSFGDFFLFSSTKACKILIKRKTATA